MGTIIKADELIKALKTGISKARDAQTLISCKKGKVSLVFKSASIVYSVIIDGEGKSFSDIEVDAQNLNKLIASYSGKDVTISVDGHEFTVKCGRSKIKIPCSPYDGFHSDHVEEAVSDGSTFSGWIKNHPLNSAASLKKAIQSIKDNVTKTELVVEAEWGKTDLLKVKLVDQFHGILAVVKLPKVPMKEKVRICIPLSSFIHLLDMSGDLYVDSTKVIIKEPTQSLECKFIAASAFGSIDDMVKLIKSVESPLKFSAKDLHTVVKKINSISESDDSISIRQEKKYLMVTASTSKAEVIESIEVEGSLASAFKLSPKNLLDISSCLIGDVSLGDEGHTIIFKSKKGDIAINGAIVKMEV